MCDEREKTHKNFKTIDQLKKRMRPRESAGKKPRIEIHWRKFMDLRKLTLKFNHV